MENRKLFQKVEILCECCGKNLLEKDFSLVYIELGLQPINISELIEKTGIEYERLSEILLQLQLDGMVEQPMENYYARVVV